MADEKDYGFKVAGLHIAAQVGETKFAIGTGYTERDMHPEEVRFDIAEQTGAPPEKIHLIGPPLDQRPQKAGKKAVAFSASRWNSSWDPHGDKPVIN